MSKVFAQPLQLPGITGTLQGPLPTLPGGGYKFTTLASLVSNALPIIFSVAGILLLLYLIWGGLDLITSLGDAKKAASARGKITNAILGLVIIIVAYWLVQIIDAVFQLGVL